MRIDFLFDHFESPTALVNKKIFLELVSGNIDRLCFPE